MPHPKKSYRESSFACARGHVTKSWQWDEVYSIQCSTCLEGAVRLNHYQPTMAQGFKPPVVAFNPVTKEYRALASEKSRVPSGFNRVELRNRSEVSAFQKSLNEQDRREFDRRQCREQAGREGYRDPLRDYKPQTRQGAEFDEYCRQREQNTYTPRFEPSNYIEAFEYDRNSGRDD